MKKQISKSQSVKPTHSIKRHVFDVKTISTIGISVIASQLLTTSLSSTPTKIYNKTYPSIYTVSSISAQRDPFSPKDVIESVKGIGTGFAYLTKGYIITNAHVVNDSFSIKVDELDAEVIGIDARHDIAVLKVNDTTHPLKKCAFPTTIGEPVLAIGNPYGFVNSITTGIISGKDRTLDSDVHIPLVGLLQTDAAINPGNSGGPLLDAKSGCIVGVNTALVSSTGVNSGIGFAVPIEVVDTIANDMINNKKHEVVQLGVSLLPDIFSESLGLHGAIIANVIPGGIASELGLVGTHRDNSGRPIIGDIIVDMNGKHVKKNSDIYEILEKLKPRDNVDITVLRKHGLHVFHVTV